MLPLRTTRRQLWTLVGAARASLEKRVAAALAPEPVAAPPQLAVDEMQLALDHIRAAWMTLRGTGRSDAQVSQTLRQMLNQLEAGRVDRN
jgi:hypothetical protein